MGDHQATHAPLQRPEDTHTHKHTDKQRGFIFSCEIPGVCGQLTGLDNPCIHRPLQARPLLKVSLHCFSGWIVEYSTVDFTLVPYLLIDNLTWDPSTSRASGLAVFIQNRNKSIQEIIKARFLLLKLKAVPSKLNFMLGECNNTSLCFILRL